MARHVHIHFTPRKTRDQAPGSVPAAGKPSPYTAIVEALMQAIADRQGQTQDADQARANNGQFASGPGGGKTTAGQTVYRSYGEKVTEHTYVKPARVDGFPSGTYHLLKTGGREMPVHHHDFHATRAEAEAQATAKSETSRTSPGLRGYNSTNTRDGGEWDESQHPRSNGGQFTAGQHTAAAANHEQAAENHKAAATSAPQGSMLATQHMGAATQHGEAAQAHHLAAKHLNANTGLGGMHAKEAHSKTFHAAGLSGKIPSTGASDIHGQLKAIASDPAAPLAKRAAAVKKLGEIEKMADAVAESPHAAKPAHGPVTTAALAGGADVGVNEAAARAQFKAAGAPGAPKPGPDGKPMGTHPDLAAANTEILKNPSTTPPDVMAQATQIAQSSASPEHKKVAIEAIMTAAKLHGTGLSPEASQRIAGKLHAPQGAAATGKPTASTAKGKAGVHELLSSGHPFSVDELMAATGVTNKSTLMTALSDLKSPKYAGKLGALEIVKRPDGQYHVAKKDGGAAPMVLDPKSSTMVPKTDLSGLQAKSDASSAEALKGLLSKSTPMAGPSGPLPTRKGPDGKDVGSAQNTQARIDAKAKNPDRGMISKYRKLNVDPSKNPGFLKAKAEAKAEADSHHESEKKRWAALPGVVSPSNPEGHTIIEPPKAGLKDGPGTPDPSINPYTGKKRSLATVAQSLINKGEVKPGSTTPAPGTAPKLTATGLQSSKSGAPKSPKSVAGAPSENDGVGRGAGSPAWVAQHQKETTIASAGHPSSPYKAGQVVAGTKSAALGQKNYKVLGHNAAGHVVYQNASPQPGVPNHPRATTPEAFKALTATSSQPNTYGQKPLGDFENKIDDIGSPANQAKLSAKVDAAFAHVPSVGGASPAMKHHGDMEAMHRQKAAEIKAKGIGNYKDHERAAQLHANALSEAKVRATSGGQGGHGYEEAAKAANGLSQNMGLDPLNTNSKPSTGTPSPHSTASSTFWKNAYKKLGQNSKK